MEASVTPIAKKFKTQPSAGKLVLTIIWDSRGHILETYLECGTAVTNAAYCDMLQTGLKLRSKRRGKLSEGGLFLHNNACLHTAAHMLKTLRKLKWEVMEHLADSPVLAPTDFHLFGPFKVIGRRRF
jgi:hypothetical protein